MRSSVTFCDSSITKESVDNGAKLDHIRTDKVQKVFTWVELLPNMTEFRMSRFERFNVLCELERGRERRLNIYYLEID